MAYKPQEDTTHWLLQTTADIVVTWVTTGPHAGSLAKSTQTVPFPTIHPFCFNVILSPKLRAMPCVLLRMRMYPPSFPSGCFSTLTFTSASSPNTLLAYKFAAKNPHSPSNAELQEGRGLCSMVASHQQTFRSRHGMKEEENVFSTLVKLT